MSQIHRKAAKFASVYLEVTCPEGTPTKIREQVRAHFELGFQAGFMACEKDAGSEEFRAQLKKAVAAHLQTPVPLRYRPVTSDTNPPSSST